ncbi:hypothetical protein T261_7649 [Streptomyces lydicus]|nr:hypothetical protein T261_7649 [Streptomyces lydicus]
MVMAGWLARTATPLGPGRAGHAPPQHHHRNTATATQGALQSAKATD